MDTHAEHFLKCPEVVKWLNTPQPVSGVPKEFLDGAHAVTSHILGLCSRDDDAASDSSVQNVPNSASTSLGRSIEKKRRPAGPSSSRASRSGACAPPFEKQPYCNFAIDPDVQGLDFGFPDLSVLGSGRAFGPRSLLVVPVELHEHFVFGVVLGCPVPPPDDVAAEEWKPLVNRFALDAGRKCFMMFSYFAEGSIVVSVDCFDEVGDHFSEFTFFEPTPVVGVFPRGIRGRMRIFEKRDCPACATFCKSCMCPTQTRIEAIVKERQKRMGPEQGPAHAGRSYKDDDVVIQTYPYWAQIMDEYKWSRTGSYCVEIQYTSGAGRNLRTPQQKPKRLAAFRATYAAEPRVKVEKMLRIALFDKGVSALKPPATDVRWETSSTISVNEKNETCVAADPVSAVCFTDWHKLPGFQEDYLLVAPSNIVSGAHARAELARAEAERLAARARSGVPVLPSWASGRAGVFEHILNESGPEIFLEAVENEEPVEVQQDFHAQMLRHIPQASVGTVMRARSSLDSAGRRLGMDEMRRGMHSLDEVRRGSLDSSLKRQTDMGRRRQGVEVRRPVGGELRPRQDSSARTSPRSSGDEPRVREGMRVMIDSNRALLERKRRAQDATSPISVMPL